MGAGTQEGAAAALGCSWSYLPPQPKGGSPKVVALRLLSSFETCFLLSVKLLHDSINKGEGEYKDFW